MTSNLKSVKTVSLPAENVKNLNNMTNVLNVAGNIGSFIKLSLNQNTKSEYANVRKDTAKIKMENVCINNFPRSLHKVL